MLSSELAAALALALLAPPQATQAPPAPAATAQTEAVTIPAYPNSTCPVMGKAISTRLFATTRYGRIYMCCKACVEEILADVEHAYGTAYPETEQLRNEVCPVTLGAIGKDAVRVTLQGREFSVANEAAAAVAIDDAQATLAKLLEPRLVDVGNATCPTTGEPAAKNVLAVIDGRIVRFHSVAAIEAAKRDPKAVLAKALELRAREDRERAQKPPAETPAPKQGELTVRYVLALAALLAPACRAVPAPAPPAADHPGSPDALETAVLVRTGVASAVLAAQPPAASAAAPGETLPGDDR